MTLCWPSCQFTNWVGKDFSYEPGTYAEVERSGDKGEVESIQPGQVVQEVPTARQGGTGVESSQGEGSHGDQD